MMIENFLQSHWRKQPLIIRGFLKDDFLNHFNTNSFFKWASSSNETIRLFSIDKESPYQYGKSAIINDNKEVAQIYDALVFNNEKFTFHMNGVELVDTRVSLIRDMLDIPFILRLDDIIATLSTKESGIGYHSGHEDGFIVQLCGSRRWKVWVPELTDLAYRQELLFPQNKSVHIEKPINDGGLVIDVVTKPGDVLYIPPFFPHEGITLEDSLSLSIAWRGISPLTFLKYLEFEGSMDIEKSVTLFEDIQDIKGIPAYWLNATIEAMDNATRKNVTSGQLQEIIDSFILSQIEKYQKLHSDESTQ